VLAALQRQGVDAHPFDPAHEPLDGLRAYDRAFIALHGGHGENGGIQGVLELMGIPYTGPGIMTSAIGMDKLRTKLIWRAVGLPVADDELLTAQSDFAAVARRLGLPLFVKPVREGSSVGVVKVTKADELEAAYHEAARHDPLVLAEAGVMSGEYTAVLLGNEILPIIKIEPATDFYNYEAKYLRDDTQYLCPCPFPSGKEAEIRADAEKAFQVLGGQGWGRVDFLMDEAGRHYFLELNTAPGMTSHSLVPIAARAAGIDYDELVVRILEGASLGHG
jgi:D-alanine-D-alanine ligase